MIFKINIELLTSKNLHISHCGMYTKYNMNRFIYGLRNRIAIFQLHCTKIGIKAGFNLISQIAYKQCPVIITGFYPSFKIISKYFKCFDIGRWRPGIISNFRCLSKKARGVMGRIPLVGILGSTASNNAFVVNEFNNIKLPLIGVIDSDYDASFVAYPIPSNNRSVTTMRFYKSLFAEAIIYFSFIKNFRFNVIDNFLDERFNYLESESFIKNKLNFFEDAFRHYLIPRKIRIKKKNSNLKNNLKSGFLNIGYKTILRINLIKLATFLANRHNIFYIDYIYSPLISKYQKNLLFKTFKYFVNFKFNNVVSKGVKKRFFKRFLICKHIFSKYIQKTKMNNSPFFNRYRFFNIRVIKRYGRNKNIKRSRNFSRKWFLYSINKLNIKNYNIGNFLYYNKQYKDNTYVFKKNLNKVKLKKYKINLKNKELNKNIFLNSFGHKIRFINLPINFNKSEGYNITSLKAIIKDKLKFFRLILGKIRSEFMENIILKKLFKVKKLRRTFISKTIRNILKKQLSIIFANYSFYIKKRLFFLKKNELKELSKINILFVNKPYLQKISKNMLSNRLKKTI